MAGAMARDKYRPNEVGAEFDEDDNGYFTYRPLSNLPTPPPVSRNSSANQSPKTALEDGEPLKAKFLGPAIHLVNLIPPSASLTTPSVPVVQAILSHANLPLDTIALAVCILDALTPKFALNWRLQCPLLIDCMFVGSSSNKRHTLPHSPRPDQPREMQMHIDSVHPEVIILAALVIAVKFMEDRQDSAQHYCTVWGRGVWSHEQLNTTERCIMESLGYRIMPLCDEELINDALVDMQLAARQRPARQPAALGRSENDDPRVAACHRKGKSTGEAVLGLGRQLTPVETPSVEDACDEALHSLGGDVRAAFGQTSVIEDGCLRLTGEVTRVPNPEALLSR